jgi:hypothetical protein
MSDSPPTSSGPWSRLLRPAWFFAGLALGLVAMAGLGRRAGDSDFHPDFTRFHPAISPEASYYPSVEEMCAIVRARCRPDQVLVIVGGNSVLQGVSQPADTMWTRKLQEKLGDRYCVVNFAFRGSSPTDGGAVIAEVLRQEFPRQIYIANEKPFTAIDPRGSETYRFLFWQAYFSGQLLSDPARNRWVREGWLNLGTLTDLPAIAGSAWLDRWLRFHVFWNRVAFEKVNTVPSLYAPAPPAMLSPRRYFPDAEIDGDTFTAERRYLPAAHAREMEILRATSLGLVRGASGDWETSPVAGKKIEANYRQAFPAAVRPRTVLLIGRDSPFYRQELTADEKLRDERAIALTVELLRSSGYPATDYGRDFSSLDYFDRTHLTATGGEKLAQQLAPFLRNLAEQLGYLK